MHVDDNKGIDFHSLKIVEVGSDEIDEIVEVFGLFAVFLFHGVFVATFYLWEDVFYSPGPPDLSGYDTDHTDFFEAPGDSFAVVVMEGGFFGHSVQGSLHFFVYGGHPYLNGSFSLLSFSELEGFSFIRFHTKNGFSWFIRLQFFTIIE